MDIVYGDHESMNRLRMIRLYTRRYDEELSSVASPDFVGAEVASDPGSLQRSPGFGGWCLSVLGCLAGLAIAEALDQTCEVAAI